MNRKDFLSGLSLAGVGSLLSGAFLLSNDAKAKTPPPPDCTLIPSETAGPFPLDLTANTEFFRQDVREDREGVQLNLRMKIIGVNNCEPMPNVRVNIWHCDKDGNYSGYQSETGLTYLRGYQIADANGEVEFVTIFPGWYPGRICHIHFQVYVSSSYSAVSQLTFDLDTRNAIYAAYPDIYTKGPDPLNYNSDNIFSDGYAYQVATLTENETTSGYDSYLEVAVQGSGVVGVGHLEKETAKQFKLGQNFPNPYVGETTIPYHLNYQSDVKLELLDLEGKQVFSTVEKSKSAGDHQLALNMDSLNLITGNYVYQMEVTNNNGSFRVCKLMTARR